MRIALFILCFVFSLDVSAQLDKIVFESHSGFLIAHRPEIRPLIQDFNRGGSISLERRPLGVDQQHHFTRFGYGLELTFNHLGNPEQLGWQGALSAYFTSSLWETNRWNQEIACSAGLGYVQKTWDLHTNLKNTIFSSHLNAALQVRTEFLYSLNNQDQIGIGLKLLHFSNGSYQLPNLGSNVAALFVRYHLDVRKEQPEDQSHLEEIHTGHVTMPWSFAFNYAAGLKENFPLGGPKHFVHTLQFKAARSINRKSKLIGQFDLHYNLAQNQVITEQYERPSQVQDRFQSGIAIGHELDIGRFGLLTQIGVYLYNLDKSYATYSRYGLNYEVTRKLSTFFYLKTHLTKAYHSEVGVGYLF